MGPPGHRTARPNVSTESRAAPTRGRARTASRCCSTRPRGELGLSPDVRGVEVRARGLDVGAGPGGRAVRDPHHDLNPGWFCTGLAGPESLIWPDVDIDDYAERSAAQRTWWEAQDGNQSGDPSKLAAALVAIAAMDPPPTRFLAGADVIGLAERKIAELQADIEPLRNLTTSLSYDNAP